MSNQGTAVSAATLTADQAVGLTVGQYMQLAGKTKSALASFIGISQPTMSRKISGKISWSVSELVDVSNFLNLDIQDLMPLQTGYNTWVPAPFNPAFLSRGIGKTPSPLDRNEDGVWRARQDSNLQPSDPKYLHVLAVHIVFAVELLSKGHIFLPQLPATLAIPATPAASATPLTLVLLFILVIAAVSTFGCASRYRKGFIK